jgi:hypothetical protein
MRDEGGKMKRRELRRQPSIRRPNPIHETAISRTRRIEHKARIVGELGANRLPENQG